MRDNYNIQVIRKRSIIEFIGAVAVIIFISVLLSFLKIRLDLTEDKRYTLSDPTRKVLSDLKSDVFIQVYLDGEMPIPFKRLKRTVSEMLDEFRIASDNRVDFTFRNPSEGEDQKQRESMYQSLISKGLNPVNIQAGDQEGGSSQKIVFPGMIVNYNGIEVPVNFLKNNPSVPAEENLLHSVEGLEYEMIQTISTLTSDTIYKIAFLEGHGELSETEVADITLNLARFFTIDRGVLEGNPGVLDSYAAVIVAGPEKEFSESDKFILDQYIMNGGKVMWLVEEVDVNADSLANGETEALLRPLNLEDQLFRYGARINPSVIQDAECVMIRLAVMTGGTRQQFVPAPWFYYPKLYPSHSHPVTRNINRVKGEYANFIDTVGLDGRIRKTILLSSSGFARTLSPPFLISLKDAETIPDEREFSRSKLPVAVLLEGVFPSAFRNRMTDDLTRDRNFRTRSESISTKMIIIADGNIIRNEVRQIGSNITPYPLGQDIYTGELYGNRDFIINCMNYLVDDDGIMELRSRELRLRMLDRSKIRKERIKWQLINVVLPPVLVIIAGFIFSYFRRRRFTKA
ncbi:MAG: gliding motility-associated ABC transporter substrate-binding protein GldG [Bacteroidales bacterium]|nr:gliding motility-associated ABC transporter substrate-binding protein GldG [Bacteroidales bacterium]